MTNAYTQQFGHIVDTIETQQDLALQLNAGEARGKIGGIAQKAHVFILKLPLSNACYDRICLAVAAGTLADP